MPKKKGKPKSHKTDEMPMKKMPKGHRKGC